MYATLRAAVMFAALRAIAIHWTENVASLIDEQGRPWNSQRLEGRGRVHVFPASERHRGRSPH